MQQTFEVLYVVAGQQCAECAKSFTPNTWRASVQVRQKVPHKRTFLYLEQLILKHQAHKEAINIKEAKDGLDFYFSARNHAEKMIDFLTSVVPTRSKKSQTLISHDVHTSTKSYKFAFAVEIIPICKDDLVALPIKLAKSLGNISPLTLCYRIGTAINLLDPATLQTADIPANIYWRQPFKNLADVQELVEFIVMDIEPIGYTPGSRYHLAEATVARAADLGRNDQTYFTRTHLGGVLHPGDSVMGYLICGANFNSPEFEALEQSSTYSSTIPDAVLVKKYYPRKKKGKSRSWKLKRMNMQEADEEEKKPKDKKADANQVEQDFEMFLRDVEEDAELRSTLALYKEQQRAKAQAEEMMDIEEEDNEDEGNDDDDDMPKIDMDELLEDFEDLNVAK